MTQTGPIIAEMLETSAAGYASAASVLLASNKDTKLPPEWGSQDWKSHLKQRILELATAIRVDEPELFVRRVLWLRRAIKARNASEGDLRASIESIRDALERELPEAFFETVDRPIGLALSSFDSELQLETVSLDPSTELGKLGLNYLSACLNAEPDQAISLIFDEIERGRPAADIYTDVLLPAQREVGELWHLGDIRVSEERLVSETTRTVMTLIANRYAPPADAERTLIAASVPGNAHDLGLRASTDLFRLAGWKTIFLGANVPSIEVAYMAQTFDAKIALLNATMTTQISALSDVVRDLRESSPGTRILVGGLAFEAAEDIWRRLGADAYAGDVRSAVAIATRLIADH